MCCAGPDVRIGIAFYSVGVLKPAETRQVNSAARVRTRETALEHHAPQLSGFCSPKFIFVLPNSSRPLKVKYYREYPLVLAHAFVQSAYSLPEYAGLLSPSNSSFKLLPYPTACPQAGAILKTANSFGPGTLTNSASLSCVGQGGDLVCKFTNPPNPILSFDAACFSVYKRPALPVAFPLAVPLQRMFYEDQAQYANFSSIMLVSADSQADFPSMYANFSSIMRPGSSPSWVGGAAERDGLPRDHARSPASEAAAAAAGTRTRCVDRAL
eukprot:6201210-Pleurochrysis_carterae.AAC.3